MSGRFTFPSIVVAIVVVVLAMVAIALGNGLLPSPSEATERGTFAPLIIIWLMIATTVVCALALAAFLFKRGLESLSERKG